MRILMQALLPFSTVILLFSSNAQAKETETSVSAFQKLSALVGTWKRKDSDGSKFQIQFELTANDTVLMERWMRKEKTHSLTVYHLDQSNLLATHYCPQGNQPRLKMAANTKSSTIKFEFMDATNLTTDQNHQHSLSFDLSDGNLIIRGETYKSGTGADTTTLSLERM